MRRRGWRVVIVALVVVLGVALGVGFMGLGGSQPTATPKGSAAATATTSSSEPTKSNSQSPGTSSESPGPTPSGAPRVAWSQLSLPDLIPAPRQGHTWTVDPDNGIAYMFGGLRATDTTATGSALGDLWAYDLGADRWQPVLVNGRAPGARSGHAAAWIDGVGLVIVSGRDSAGGALDDSWRFDPSTSSWQELEVRGIGMPARSESCAIVDRDGSLWMIDGRGTTGDALQDVWRYRPSAAGWDLVDLGRPAPERFGHVCWLGPDGRARLFGGRAGTVVGDLWSIDLAGGGSGSWTQLRTEEGVEPREAAAAAVHAERPVIVGGLAADGSPLGSVASTNPAGDTMVRVEAHAPELPGRARAALIDDPAAERMLLFGGLTATGISNELWQAVLD